MEVDGPISQRLSQNQSMKDPKVSHEPTMSNCLSAKTQIEDSVIL